MSSAFDDQGQLQAGAGRLTRVDEAELSQLLPGADKRSDLSGKRVLHLRCDFGADALTLAQRGASVLGLDFSVAATRQAPTLAQELGLEEQTRFLASNLYDARHAQPTAIRRGRHRPPSRSRRRCRPIALSS
jgi:cyclopropane fatty-acyl-phospholipid synthase-like methyltransferase